ncbi:hypothetical protein [Streptomyces sp. NPDC088785]|uniref:hypothetical protein n=1 Tax=Streptomyces sp. NPDC088785 TaxID=3365897 RepID=UPI00380E10D2
MTDHRRTLGPGPASRIQGPQADLMIPLPTLHLPDITAMRARGVIGHQPAAAPAPRRALGTGTAPDAQDEQHTSQQIRTNPPH